MTARRHPCPGGCGRVPLVRTVTCADCRATLPAELRRAVEATAGKPAGSSSRRAASRAAAEFLQRRRVS